MGGCGLGWPDIAGLSTLTLYGPPGAESDEHVWKVSAPEAGGAVELAYVNRRHLAFCAMDIERTAPTASASPRFNDCNANQRINRGLDTLYTPQARTGGEQLAELDPQTQ